MRSLISCLLLGVCLPPCLAGSRTRSATGGKSRGRAYEPPSGESLEPDELPDVSEVVELSEVPESPELPESDVPPDPELPPDEVPPSLPLVDDVVNEDESLVVTVSPPPPLAEVPDPPSLPDAELLGPGPVDERSSPLESRPLACDPLCSPRWRASSMRTEERGR
jgi:hypothetical protein